MKIFTTKLVATLLLFATIGVGCNTEGTFDLVGQWKYATWFMGDRQVDLGELGTPIIDFNSDGTFKATLGANSSSEKWELDNDTLKLIYSDGNIQAYALTIFNADSIQLQGNVGDNSTKLILVKTK